MTTKIKSFVKQFIAQIQGDDAEVKAQKVFRQATSALEVQIANLEGELVGAEEDVYSAEEALQNARVNNGNLISSGPSYVANLIAKKNAVEMNKETLEKIKEKIKFLKTEKKEISEEVEA